MNKGGKQTRLTLKTVQSNMFSKTHTGIAIHFNLPNFCQFVPSFGCVVLFQCSFTVLSGYFNIKMSDRNFTCCDKKITVQQCHTCSKSCDCLLTFLIKKIVSQLSLHI